MSFGEGPAQEAGILILAINVLAPGGIIVKDIREDIIKKWKKEKWDFVGQEVNSFLSLVVQSLDP